MAPYISAIKTHFEFPDAAMSPLEGRGFGRRRYRAKEGEMVLAILADVD